MPIFGYRSHQQVTVLKLAFRGSGGTPPERAENGQPAGYRIRFADGFEGDAFDHETALQLLSPRSTDRNGGWEAAQGSPAQNSRRQQANSQLEPMQLIIGKISGTKQEMPPSQCHALFAECQQIIEVLETIKEYALARRVVVE
jgi:hypothetical protein